MSTHTPIVNGLTYLIHITKSRGFVMGSLEDKDTGEIIFESEFPTYKDAYWALQEFDENAFLERRGHHVS